MAVGRPVIGSPVGANSQIIQHGVNGFLAKTTEEWIEALLRLSGNAKLLQKMSIAARKTVESQYSTQITAPRLASIFDEVVEERFLPSREMAYTC
jgi:glycosyltransferase involved in cell wall biosynthesis